MEQVLHPSTDQRRNTYYKEQEPLKGSLVSPHYDFERGDAIADTNGRQVIGIQVQPDNLFDNASPFRAVAPISAEVLRYLQTLVRQHHTQMA